MKGRLGFSLIELLIVIAIIGILAISGVGIYVNSLKTSQDSRRKADLSTIQKGLELYYTDLGAFPTTAPVASSTRLCANGFTTAAACTAPVYIQSLPKDPTGTVYYYTTDVGGTYYKIYSTIERTDDTGTGVKLSGYTGTSCNGSLCKYGTSSTNTTP